ncbi:MAG: prolyl oligopeptidase family serine peptidase, partial [Prevotella sp.]|nr:prolyl oligopeptidase family serine peptidase [Prevotella sp.]
IIAGNMMMLGRDLSAFMTYDDIAATDFLATLPEVDSRRIGCAGCSMGGYRAWMLAALSDKIQAGACICWMGSTFAQLSNHYGRKENGGFANCIPGLRQYMDYPHIASLACPKPMLFVSGKQDRLFPIAGVEAAYDVMHQVWKSQGADAKLSTFILDQPHECNLNNQQAILEFMKESL